MESFLHPIAQERNVLASGLSGATVADFSEPQVVQVCVPSQFTADMAEEDKLLKAIGGNGEHSCRLQIFAKVGQMCRYYYPLYAPDNPSPSKHQHFDVGGESTPRRPAAYVLASVIRIEDARRAGGSKTTVRMFSQKKGFEGYSLFICSSPEDTVSYLSLKCPWDVGPDLLLYDTMLFILLDVVPSLWGQFSGENQKLDDEKPCIMLQTIHKYIGREMTTGCKTISFIRTRSLRDLQKHSGSDEAVHWMYFLLCTGEAVVDDRNLRELFNMVLFICHDSRLIIKPGVLTEAEQREVAEKLQRFGRAFDKHVHSRKEGRLRVCKTAVVAIADLQQMADTEWLQSFISVRGPLKRPRII